MSVRYGLLKVLLLMFAAVAVCGAAVLGVDRALPLLCTVPVYTPALSSLGPHNLISRYVSHDFDCTVRTNSFGMRGPEISIARTGKFRIAVIGSSYTFGWGVNDDACFVHLLERGLNARGLDVEVLNLGRNGGSPRQYAMLAEEVVPLLKPDLVIVAVGQGIDLEWSGPVPLREWLPHVTWSLFPNLTSLANAPSRPEDGGQAAMPAPVPTDEQVAVMKKGTVKLARETYQGFSPAVQQRFDRLDEKVKDAFLSGGVNVGVIMLSVNSPDLYTHAFHLESGYCQSRLGYLGKYIGAIARTARGTGASTLVVSVPFGPYVNECAMKNYERLGFDRAEGMLTSSAPDEAIQRASGELPFLSATEGFRKQSSNARLFFEFDLHLAADGHALFCEQLLPWVEEHVRAAKGARQK